MKYKIIIDPGHGGDDPGTSGNGIIEKDINLKISLEMYNILK
ncbi:MAG: N-acetylmuramoyl-L-alanine amidase, partial [Bacilli bacterium]